MRHEITEQLIAFNTKRPVNGTDSKWISNIVHCPPISLKSSSDTKNPEQAVAIPQKVSRYSRKKSESLRRFGRIALPMFKNINKCSRQINSREIFRFFTVTLDQIDSRIVLFEATARMEYGRCVARIRNAHLNTMARYVYTNRSIQSDFDPGTIGNYEQYN